MTSIAGTTSGGAVGVGEEVGAGVAVAVLGAAGEADGVGERVSPAEGCALPVQPDSSSMAATTVANLIFTREA
ncbi:MAG: hypothetical protein JWR04_419 [Rhodoglobus sp.]|nr:hypothetical protein [Rhodoglobus sp.]